MKKRVSERVLQRVVYIIWSETLGRRLTSAKSRQESCRESHQESSRDSLRDFRRNFCRNFCRGSWRDFSCSPSVSPESRIGLYAWLSARLSLRLVFLRGCQMYCNTHMWKNQNINNTWLGSHKSTFVTELLRSVVPSFEFPEFVWPKTPFITVCPMQHSFHHPSPLTISTSY